jgi:Xaa-Pro aminopeptidase
MNLLIYGDTERSAALRHEVPIEIGDPFLYLESEDRRAVITNALEDARLARAAPSLERLLQETLGSDELVAQGLSRAEIDLELAVRATSALGIREAVVPSEFPVALADRLREAGVSLTPDDTTFADRRRRKSPEELAGIRRAADVAVAAIAEAAKTLRESEIRGGELWSGGERLTSEIVRSRIRELSTRAGAPAPADIMVKDMGPDLSIGHDPGSGPLRAEVPILIDLWPRDERSGCWADMTRCFVRGEISDRIAAIHTLVLSAHERSCAAIKPGAQAVEVYGIACDEFEAAGYATARSKQPGETLREGFYHGLGHGVGLEVHEQPTLGRAGRESLIEGDVLAVEPGTVDREVGGVRVEDLLLVTDAGNERLTEFPYSLEP